MFFSLLLLLQSFSFLVPQNSNIFFLSWKSPHRVIDHGL
uniref:Uncharacterized protein n=1 Tax=Rhizophora mucronata TaxID=61149 RepID=A0A2P2N560_RHIMU